MDHGYKHSVAVDNQHGISNADPRSSGKPNSARLLFAICTTPTQYFAKREGRENPSFPLNFFNLPDLRVYCHSVP